MKITLQDLPMGGCSTASAHYAHLDAGDPLCQNQQPGPCPCECNHGGFCGGCGHAGCGGRR